MKNGDRARRASEMAEMTIEAFGQQTHGKKQRDWSQAEWLEFLGGWQYARLKNFAGPDTAFRRLGIMVATLLEPGGAS